MHRNTSLSSVNGHLVISYSIIIIAIKMESYSSNFVKALISTAATPRGDSLNVKFTFKGTSPTIHICTDR